ncbi:MAG: glycerophosphodiester phosphodiesterase family protein, partial [Flavitalea sp.]
MEKRALLIAVNFLCMTVMAQQMPNPLPETKNGFVVIAHRGNHEHAPENTLASVKDAVKAGADYIEIDLRTTKDGRLVLHHDGSVDRMTDGKGKVIDLTFKEIQRLKVLNPDKSDTKTYRIAEFKDVLHACKKKINIYLDFKDADVAETYRQIKDAGMEKQVIVYLNKEAQYKQWRKVAPAMPLMTSLPEAIKTKEQLDFFLGQIQIEALDNIYDSAMVSIARKHGVAIWLDVESDQENEALWKEAMDKNIHGVQTDHPEELIRYLLQNNLRNGSTANTEKINTAPAKGYVLPAYRKLSDIKYSKNDKTDNIMDAYIPQDYDNAKVIVYLHGGGWTGGDKGEFPQQMIEELTGKRKYIVVSMNYRLVKDGKNLFPTQMEDIRDALVFLSRNAKKYHYNGNEFALMGGSAGAYLAMEYAYGYDSAKQIKAVVDFWGPTDLSDKAVRAENKDADSKVVTLLGIADPQSQACINASPYFRLTKETGVPTILFHGGEDPLVHVSQSEKMYAKLLSLNIPAQFEL